jgi:hypothetical protein
MAQGQNPARDATHSSRAVIAIALLRVVRERGAHARTQSLIASLIGIVTLIVGATRFLASFRHNQS